MFDNVRLVKTLNAITELEPTLEALVEEMRVLQEVVSQMGLLRDELKTVTAEMSRTAAQLEQLNEHAEEVLEAARGADTGSP